MRRIPGHHHTNPLALLRSGFEDREFGDAGGELEGGSEAGGGSEEGAEEGEAGVAEVEFGEEGELGV